MSDPSGRPERPEPRILRDVTLVAWGLNPAGSPYSGRPEDAPQAFPHEITCPVCHGVTALPHGGSDDELDAFWAHLRIHTTHPLVLVQLWVTAMGRAR